MAKTSKKMDGTSKNPQEELFSFLKKQFPEVFNEGKVDCQKLKMSIGEQFSDEPERFGLTWTGKSNCFREIQTPTTATLKPVREESVDFDTTENIFIEGDNLEVLKILQKSYYGKVKMIYIDPPYNTGNDFIYNDDFKKKREEYLRESGQKDEEGNLRSDGLIRNTRDRGHYHSDWLNMMYPRLFLARNLLRQDGVIFVSIDDNEVHNLRAIMNEVFGEENFVDCLIWKKRYGGGSKEKHFVSVHEYVLVYARDIQSIGNITVPLTQESIKRYYTLKDDNFETRGAFRTHPLEATKSMGDRPNLVFPIKAPDRSEIMPKRQWLWSKKRVEEAEKNNELYFIKTKDGWSVHTKQYLKELTGENREGKMQSLIDDVFTQHGTNEIIDLFGNAQIFSFPKPSAFILKLVASISGKNDTILDFFAGSGTTAHAIMKLNEEDGGSRKCISIQLPEQCEEESDAYKAGYKTIADISKERIRRAGKKIFEERDKKLDLNGNKIDAGFKVFKLDESNFKIWRKNIKDENQLQKSMEDYVDNLKGKSKREDVLYELMVKSGLDLNAKVEKKKAGKMEYFKVNDGEMLIFLEDEISKELVQAILSEKPQQFICLDRCFGGNDQLKTNAVLQMEREKIEFKVI